MAKQAVYDYSTTPASNTDIDGVDSTGTTGLVKSGDNYARSMMAHAKGFALDLGSVNTVGGTADATTVTLSSAPSALVDGMRFTFNAVGANTTNMTLNVTPAGGSAFGAKKVMKWSAGSEAELSANDIPAANALIEVIYDSARNAAAGAWMLLGSSVAAATTSTAGIVKLEPVVCDGRLTLTTGVPVTTADVTGAGTLYFTPYNGNHIGLYASSAWSVVNFSETSLALTLTSGKPYDIFAYSNAGTLALESLVWTDDTTRATALTTQDGIYVKSGDATRRYIGTIYASGSNTTEDSAAKRYVWNMYNRKLRSMRVLETTNSWNYTTATLRQANGSTANQLDFVRGLNEDAVDATVHVGRVTNPSAVSVNVSIGLDSTSAKAAESTGGQQGVISAGDYSISAYYRGFPGVGRHILTWLERSSAAGTTTWSGDDGGSLVQSGIVGVCLA